MGKKTDPRPTDKKDNDMTAKDGNKNGYVNHEGRRTANGRTFECVHCGFYKCRCDK